MRAKVIPKRGLRLWEPVLLAIIASWILRLDFLVTPIGMAGYYLFLLSPVFAFGLIEAIRHRTILSVAVRNVLFGSVFSFALHIGIATLNENGIVSLAAMEPLTYLYDRLPLVMFWPFFLTASGLMPLISICIGKAIDVVRKGRKNTRSAEPDDRPQDKGRVASRRVSLSYRLALLLGAAWTLVWYGVTIQDFADDHLAEVRRFTEATTPGRLILPTLCRPEDMHRHLEPGEWYLARVIDVSHIAEELGHAYTHVQAVYWHTSDPNAPRLQLAPGRLTDSARGVRFVLNLRDHQRVWHLDDDSAKAFLENPDRRRLRELLANADYSQEGGAFRWLDW